MATLVVPGGEFETPLDFVLGARSLAEWLAGDWALVFSHPRDFSDDGIETDRWLSILHDKFIDRGVRPVALSRSPLELDRSWVSEVVADHSLVTLPPDSADAASITLREQLSHESGHYVAIVDETLERRGILRYVHSAMQLLSPLDLLGSVDAMRKRDYRWSFSSQRRAHIPC